MSVSKHTLREGVKEHVDEVDFFGETGDEQVTFTILLGDLSDADVEAVERSIRGFEDQYDVTCTEMETDGLRKRYTISQE